MIILMDGRVVLAHYAEFIAYSNTAEQLAIAWGVAILTGVRARLAAILLTAMYASFTALVLVPMLLNDPSSFGNWTENATSLALTGVAWVVADSLAAGSGPSARQGLRSARGDVDIEQPRARKVDDANQ